MKDGTRSWEPRSSFVDEDGTMNDIFKTYCETTRIPTGPPKKRARKDQGQGESKERGRGRPRNGQRQSDNEEGERGRGSRRGRPRKDQPAIQDVEGARGRGRARGRGGNGGRGSRSGSCETITKKRPPLGNLQKKESKKVKC